MLHNLDLEHHRPPLPGHKNPVVLRVVSDPIQDRLVINPLLYGQQSFQVDPCDNLTVLWRNPRNHFRVPDIRINLPFDELQLIELANDFASVFHHDMTRFSKSFRIAKAQRRRPIAGNQFLPRTSHAPALPRVGKALHHLQAESVIDETDMRLPGPLVNIGTPIHDPLAKIFRRQIATLQYPSRFWSNRQDRRVPTDSDSFIKYSVEIEKAFRVTVSRMRERRHYPVPVDRRSLRMIPAKQQCRDDKSQQNFAQGIRSNQHWRKPEYTGNRSPSGHSPTENPNVPARSCKRLDATPLAS